MKTKQLLISSLTCASLFFTILNADPLQKLIKQRSIKEFHTTLDEYGNPNERDLYTDKTPLHVMAETRYAGDNQSATVKIGEKTIVFPSCQDGLGIMSHLIETGADVNARDVNNDTPLHLAAREGKVLYVLFLLLQGAHPVRNLDGKTPLDEIKDIVGGKEVSMISSAIEEGKRRIIENQRAMTDLILDEYDVRVPSSEENNIRARMEQAQETARKLQSESDEARELRFKIIAGLFVLCCTADACYRTTGEDNRMFADKFLDYILDRPNEFIASFFKNEKGVKNFMEFSEFMLIVGASGHSLTRILS